MIGYLDCSTGLSGDKVLGALVGAGFDIGKLRDVLVAMGLTGIVVEAEPRTSGGVTGYAITVTEPDAPRRHWRTLRELLEGPAVPEAARTGALRALGALAAAEAEVHGVDIEKVHFHEIGAADTLVDTLGVAMALVDLGITRLVSSPIAVGGGTVITEHGELPIPAPATAVLLQGKPVVPGAAGGELTTPTGAALADAFVTGFGTIPSMVLRRVGTGCGTRELGMPNVCRLLVGDEDLIETGVEPIVTLETNIDHLTPEELAVAAERIRGAGALDVWQTPILMKKGRSATLLSVLAGAAEAPRLAERIISLTGTLGVRMIAAERMLVERDVAEVDTTLGRASFKVAYLPDVGRVLRVESDDAARLASQHGMAVDAAARILERDAARVTGIQPMRQPPSTETTNPSA